MILFSHPRSGSQWFLNGLMDYKYPQWEMFSSINNIPGTIDNANWGAISFPAKINMMNVGAKTNKVFKIHLTQIAAEMQKDTWPILQAAIQKHELYLLTRQDKRAAILSFLIARYNNYNFHNSNNTLTNTGCINKDSVMESYNLICRDTAAYQTAFNYKEEFVYEELLAGLLPKTLNWNPDKSQIIKRSSMELLNLIDNKDEVIGWIDEIFANR